MKKSKIFSIALILIALILVATSVNAATWEGQTTVGSTVGGVRSITGVTLSINFGEVDSSGNLITRVNIPLSKNESESGTIKAGCPASHYSMSLDNVDSNGIVTGLYTGDGTTNGREKLNVNVLKTGTQTIHIKTARTSDDWPNGVNSYDNTVTVVSSYSNNFQNAAKALGITFNSNNTVYNADNVNVYPTNNDKFEDIIKAKSKYDALNSFEKQRLDSIISSASSGTYANYTALYNAADNYLTSLARIFISSTSVQGLKGNTVANKTNYETIINAETEYNGLKDIVKDRVNLILTSDSSSTYPGYSSVDYPTLLIEAKAYKFIDTYILDTPDGELSRVKDEKMLDSEIDSTYKWEDLAEDVKDEVNSILVSKVGRNYTNEIAFVRNHLEQTLADSFVDNTFLSDYEGLAGTKSLRNYNKNTEMNNEITNKYENLAKKITGDVNTEYDTIATNKYVDATSLKQKIDTEIVNSSYASILESAKDYLDDLTAAREFVSQHKITEELTAEIAEDIITLGDAITDTRVKAMVENIIGKNMEEKIEEADNYLTELANNFIEKHYLKELANNNIAAKVIKEGNNRVLLFGSNGITNELTKEMAQDIVKDDTTKEFNNLTPTVKSRVLAKTLSATKFENIVAGAQAFLDDIEAEEFIEDNKLDEDFTKSSANNIVNNLEQKYKELSSDNVRGLVKDKLEKTIEEIIEEAKDYLNRTAAQDFYDNYLDGLEEEKIVAGEDAWNNSNETVQKLINELLKKNNVDSTYPELLKNARESLNNKAAEQFINEYLTQEDGKVIGEVKNSNYKKVLKAADPYKALSDDVKEIVNSKLTSNVNTTYPKLLAAAQAIDKSPKTGDLSGLMAGILVVSVIGLAIVIKKKK